MSTWRNIAVALGLVTVALAPAETLAFGDENWPCVQRKVEHLSWGQMWTGPVLPENSNWRKDGALSQLVPLLTARAIALEDLAAPISALAATEEETRDERLTRLFAGAFEQIDNERFRIIGGISGFAEKQRGLSEQIDAKRKQLAELELTANQTNDNDAWDAFEAMEDQVFWDTRIYQDRQRSITYICESPVLLEKRAFAIAQLIMGELARE